MSKMKTKELTEKIRDWLETQGYPLEMKVASALRKVGFNVMQSQYYIDPETDVPREIDIIAYKNDVRGECEISFLIECKVSKKKPWLLFSSEEALQRNIFFNFAVLSESAINNLLNLNKEITHQIPWMRKRGRIAYGLTQAFTSGDDYPYKASLNVLKAAVSKKLEFKKSKSFTPINVFFPVIIMDGEIFECFLDDNAKVNIEKINEAFYLSDLTIANEFATCIHIISAEKLEYFAEQAKNVADKLLSLFEKTK